jgi:hypothetical protein
MAGLNGIGLPVALAIGPVPEQAPAAGKLASWDQVECPVSKAGLKEKKVGLEEKREQAHVPLNNAADMAWRDGSPQVEAKTEHPILIFT